MAKQEKKPISAWHTQVLRLTAFYHRETQFDISDWWNTLVGGPPENEIRKSKENTLSLEGSVGDSKLILSKSPIVVDFRMQFPYDSKLEKSTLSNVGNFETDLSSFIETSKKLLGANLFPEITRLAFGAVLSLPLGNDIKESYEQLIPYLESVKIDASNTRDLLYRINRRRPSKLDINALEINRLSTWSIVVYKLIPLIEGLELPEPDYACNLDLDISTCQEFQENLPQGKLQDIFQELIDIGKEIVSEGDTA
jgi:hypothetical protein